MYKDVAEFFRPKPLKILYEILEQSRLLISRLNEESKISVPNVITMVNKNFKDFEDELFCTFSALLSLSKRVEEHKAEQNEFPEWFETKMKLTSEHVFSVFSFLNKYHYNKLEKFIIDFYKEKEKIDGPIYDIRDKLRSF